MRGGPPAAASRLPRPQAGPAALPGAASPPEGWHGLRGGAGRGCPRPRPAVQGRWGRASPRLVRGESPRAPEKPRVWEPGWRRPGVSLEAASPKAVQARVPEKAGNFSSALHAVPLPGEAARQNPLPCCDPSSPKPTPPSSSRPRAPCTATSIPPGPRGSRSEVLPSSEIKVLGTDVRLLPKPRFLSPLGRKLRYGSSSLLFYDMPHLPKLLSKEQANRGKVPSDRCAPCGLAILLLGYLNEVSLLCKRAWMSTFQPGH